MQNVHDAIRSLARAESCPRCDLQKTQGAVLCSRCRLKLPSNMRIGLERVERYETGFVARAMRAAANYFDLRFQSVRNFGGGRRR